MSFNGPRRRQRVRPEKAKVGTEVETIKIQDSRIQQGADAPILK